MSQFSLILNRLRQSTFFANLATLSAGTVVAQLIPFVATVILSRLYNPDEMGEWGVFSSYGAILAIVGCLRYDGSIVKAKSQSDAYQLTYIAIAFSLAFTVLLYLISFVIHLIGIDVGMNISAVYMLPIYVFTLLLVQALSNLATYLRRYKLIATNSINRSISQTGSRILLGFVKSNRQGMIIGAIIGNIISLFTLCGSINIIKNRKCIQRDRSLELIKENKKFPIFDLPSNLLNSVSSHCPPILLSWYFLGSVVGLFSMAQNLLYIPMSFVGSSVSQLYYKDASECINNGLSISALTRRLFVSLFSFGALFMCLLIVCEDWLFGFVLGAKWTEVGHYVVLLSPWLLLVTALSPLSTVFYVKDKQMVNMNLNILGVIMRVASIVLVGSWFHLSNYTVFSFGIASFVFYIIQGYYILKYGEAVFTKRDYFILGILAVVFAGLYSWKTMIILS